MLESLVASILNRILGSYVENFDPKQLQIGLLSGDVKLAGLKLKQGALDQLQLPLNIVNGHIGSLVLQIPYSNLKSKPVKVLIEDVFLIAKPDMDHEEEGQKRREQAAKIEKLQIWEISSERAMSKTTSANSASADSEAERQKQQNFTSSLVSKIIENLQVTIRNIHVRFEDLDTGVALGATLGELSAISTNKEWEPAFIADVGTTTHKLATLDSLAFYIDPEVSTKFTKSSADKAQMLEEFKALIFDSVGATDILRPINGQGFITMNKQPANETVPRVKADLKFEELSVNLDREQYVDALRLTDQFQKYFNLLKYRKHRPRTTVSEDPLAWFRYAANTVLDSVRENRRRWTWEAMKQHLDDQKLYVDLYKKWYRAGSSEQGFTPQELTAFNDIQSRHSYDDIVFFRSLAKQQLVNERKDNPAKQQQQGTQTWGEWLWGSKGTVTTNNSKGTSSTETSGESIESAAPIEISEKERQELLDVLDVTSLNEDSASQVLIAVEFSLRSAGVRLKTGDIALASAGFEGVKTKFINRSNSFAVEMSVDKFEVSDLSRRNQFSEIIRVQQNSQNSEKDPFFWFLFEHHPVDKVADSNLFLKSQSVVIVHNARLLESVIKFFAPPPDQGDTVDAILMAANRTVEELREQTRIGLEYALENHKTLNLRLDVKAPTIIIPLDTNDSDSAAAVLDVGSLQVASDLVPQNVLSEVKSKQALKYAESDWKRLESLMYDRFTVKLCDTQILLGERMSDINKSLGQDSSQLHFLDKATLQFLLEMSIVPKNHNLTRCRVSIKLPSLRATLADVQYLLFMKILAAATPCNTDQDPAEIQQSNRSQNQQKPELIEGGDSVPGDRPGKPEHYDASSTPESRNTGNAVVEKAKPPQKTFELIFIANEVRFFVVRGWGARPLIDVCLHDFNVKTWSNEGLPEETLGVDLTVKDLLITDHVDTSGPAELRKVAESAGHDGGNVQNSNLFKVEYRKSLTGDMRIDVTLAEIKFNLNANTVLSIYDYIMSTFTSPQVSTMPSPRPQSPAYFEDSKEPHDADNRPSNAIEPATEHTSNRINVCVNMHGISAVLVDNNQPVATMSLERAQLNVDMKDAMKIQFILGTVSIIDQQKNDLLSIEGGNNLVDFRYETEPLPTDPSYPELPALIYLRMGCVRLQIIQEPLTHVVSFLTRFTVMKAAYDQARMMAFNQAIQVEPGKFRFDVIISTPIILWPQNDEWMRLDLGEVYVQNKFVGSTNNVKSGIRNVLITSMIGGNEQQIVPKTDFTIKLSHSPDSKDKSEPITNVNAVLSPIHVRASEHQYRFIMQFINALNKISAGTASAGIGMDEVGNLRRQLAKEKHIEEKQTSYWWGENFSVTLGDSGSQNPLFSERPKFKFGFEAPLFDITLDFENKPLSKFAIQEIAVEIDVDKNADTEASFYLKSLAVEDLGNAEKNKFPQIIPPVKNDEQQIMGRLLQRKGQRLNVECSIDSPQVIVALEYLISLQNFLEYGNIPPTPSDQSENESDFDDEFYDDESAQNFYSSSMNSSENSLGRRSRGNNGSSIDSSKGIEDQIRAKPIAPAICINIVDMYLTVLADESDANSEAIVFKIEQLIMNYGETSSISLAKVGMFLTRMQTFEESRLRILDDFNITSSIDNSESTESLRLTNIQANMDPLILRISLREIELILEIASKASAIWASGNTNAKKQGNASSNKPATNFFADDHRMAKLGKRSHSISAGNHLIEGAEAGKTHETLNVMRVLAENLTAQFEGIRLVLIDPIHQLPMTDFYIKPFSLVARNWSDSLVVNAKAELFANVHSFTKSAWEPLVDTMDIGLSVTGDAIELYTNAIADIELTPETIELGHYIQSYFSDSSSRTYKRVRQEEGAPYRIKNETGIPIVIWADSKSSNNRRKIANNQEIRWSFHDWRELRENLNATDQDSSLGIEFEADGYEMLRSVPVNRIGEHVYVVKRGDERRRIVFDIWVENHLKYISIRSTEVIKNHTGTELEMLVVGDNFRELMKLPPHSELPLPISLVGSRLLIRRQGDSKWPSKALYWRDIVKEGNVTTTLKCSEFFYLSVHPEIPNVPLSEKYPYLVLNLSAPFQIINNLSENVHMRLYSREMRHESNREITKSGRVLVHDYCEDVLLLLRVDVPGYTCDKFAVINTGKRYEREFHMEDVVEISHGNQKLQLKLDYVDLPHGEGRVIVIYTPYLIMNSTEYELCISAQRNKIICDANSSSLWSFNNISSQSSAQRVTLSTQESQPSAPVSLNATGSTAEISVISRDRQRELYLGVVVTQGSGRYVNTKIVNISPRFIFCNNMNRPIVFREPGGRNDTAISPGKRVPVGFIRSMANKEACVKFGDSDNAEWGSSFSMMNVGMNHVRMIERGKPTVLMKVEVVMEGASLFLHMTDATMWPYSIRNFTDQEFIFYQSDPLVDEDGVELSGHSSANFTPITYRLPPKSAMPYSWDFPAAAVKQVVIEPSGQPPAPRRPPALPSRPSSSASSLNLETRSSAASISDSVMTTGSSSRSPAPSETHRRGHRTRRRYVQLAEIGELPPANFGGGIICDISVIADGPQQAMVIAPHSPEASNYDAKTSAVKAEALAEVEAIDATTGRAIRLNMKGIGISCITLNSQELLYVTFRNVKASYHVSDALDTVSLQVQWIQVDNMLPGSNDFPVIIYPTVLPKAAEELAAHPCFSASLTRVRDDSYGLMYIKHATLLLQEMTIEADEDFLLALVDMVISLATRKDTVDNHNKGYQPLLDDNSALCDEVIHVPTPTTEYKGDDIYFEQLHLQPIQLNLSFMRTGSLSTSAIFKDNNVAGSLAFVIDALTLTIGNINDAPVRFNALLVDNVRTEPATLMNMIQVHYQQEFIYQLHKIVGSADIIGNPVGLFNNISSGVADLFYEPYMGYTLNERPQEFGVGLAKGGLSFMKKSVFGISDSVSKVTGALSKGLSAITLDPRFQTQQRSRKTRNRPRHAVHGLKYGVESFYESFSSGVMGLAEQPMQGAVTNGGAGFFRGLGQGLIGLPTKTTIGLLDFASNLTEGIRNTTTVFDQHEIARVRLPRVISTDGVIRPYNVRESVGQMVLHSVKDSKFSKDRYVAHSNITKNKIVIVSMERILVATLNDLNLEWAVNYDQVDSFTMEKTGIAIGLVGGVHGPFIPLDDESSRQYIYKSIGKGVDNYNRLKLTLY